MERSIVKIDDANNEQMMAFKIVKDTNGCLFVTGKAGTGKTTFINLIQKEIKKNFLILAPTGIAAINAGGQTIHSFFGFPMEVIGPHTKVEIAHETRQILKHVDTIIIDEASMVRCDLVDGMDRYLRQAFQTNEPFGGKQIIFVGDLYQLPPVVKKGSADEEMLVDLYGPGIPFFYKAMVLRRINLPKIEFQKIYRQNNPKFIEVLNHMREGAVTNDDLLFVNKHIQPDSTIPNFSVILTAYNGMAEKINNEKLSEIKSNEYIFHGIIKDNFNRKDSPVPEELRLKEGAQVIFCRNDLANGCVNGTIAQVCELSDERIVVELEDRRKVVVNKYTWESVRRVYNREARKMESEVIGSYTQYPIKLAWAITIHRSQGMTFDRMHLDLTRGLFNPGQAYVALSRLRTIEGLTLNYSLRPHHIINSPEVLMVAKTFNDIALINEETEIQERIFHYKKENNFDDAVKFCLEKTINKVSNREFRKAALLAKQMFDLMLDDGIIIGQTDNVPLIQSTGMTANFLNSLICLYGHRYEEAIKFADMVIERKPCIEAMFIKARACYEAEKYNDAHDVLSLIIFNSSNLEEKKAIDKKIFLFEGRLNEKLGCPNITLCKKLIKLCPEYTPAYLMVRTAAMHKNAIIPHSSGNNKLIEAFNNSKLSHNRFKMIFQNTKRNSEVYKNFKSQIMKLED